MDLKPPKQEFIDSVPWFWKENHYIHSFKLLRIHQLSFTIAKNLAELNQAQEFQSFGDLHLFVLGGAEYSGLLPSVRCLGHGRQLVTWQKPQLAAVKNKKDRFLMTRCFLMIFLFVETSLIWYFASIAESITCLQNSSGSLPSFKSQPKTLSHLDWVSLFQWTSWVSWAKPLHRSLADLDLDETDLGGTLVSRLSNHGICHVALNVAEKFGCFSWWLLQRKEVTALKTVIELIAMRQLSKAWDNLLKQTVIHIYVIYHISI